MAPGHNTGHRPVDDERTEMARTKKVQLRPSKRTNELRDEGCGGVGADQSARGESRERYPSRGGQR